MPVRTSGRGHAPRIFWSCSLYDDKRRATPCDIPICEVSSVGPIYCAGLVAEILQKICACSVQIVWRTKIDDNQLGDEDCALMYVASPTNQSTGCRIVSIFTHNSRSIPILLDRTPMAEMNLTSVFVQHNMRTFYFISFRRVRVNPFRRLLVRDQSLREALARASERARALLRRVAGTFPRPVPYLWPIWAPSARGRSER
ncbi:hypothetical protein EVAR_51302_1 [Eumeta japonica]|uniref:Uncharacterized protein n=1 Tax=Eumeta variegata TaxID=151549 RepID=A0A4C1XSV8_EUMVA|nr:hypothetical protein EVAR_51302_1 [Eumeta japonica]